MADYTYKQGSLEPAITRVLGIDLTTATSVLFRMADAITRAEKFSRSATVTDAPTGAVSYTLQAGDTDAPGVFYAEFAPQFAGPRERAIPNSGYLVVAIEPRL